MVSDDTHARTIALLEKFDYFDLKKEQVEIIRQENVPALLDNASIAFDKESQKVLTKPHGHGDVHCLLYNSGLVTKWKDLGKEWLVFVQDTNALAMKAFPSVIGVSAKN